MDLYSYLIISSNIISRKSRIDSITRIPPTVLLAKRRCGSFIATHTHTHISHPYIYIYIYSFIRRRGARENPLFAPAKGQRGENSEEEAESLSLALSLSYTKRQTQGAKAGRSTGEGEHHRVFYTTPPLRYALRQSARLSYTPLHPHTQQRTHNAKASEGKEARVTSAARGAYVTGHAARFFANRRPAGSPEPNQPTNGNHLSFTSHTHTTHTLIIFSHITHHTHTLITHTSHNNIPSHGSDSTAAAPARNKTYNIFAARKKGTTTTCCTHTSSSSAKKSAKCLLLCRCVVVCK